MPRSIWKGALSFGLVSIPVKVYGATEEKDLSFRQIHAEDMGRIKYKRVCDTCSEEIPFAEISKGYEAPDGRMAVLTSEDFADLPLKTLKTVDVVQFVSQDEIDPRYFQKTYFIEAEGVGAKPYVLMRDALAKTNKVAVVKVALRSRESLAVVRPVGDLLVLHTMLWPDELRDGSFAAPPAVVAVSEAEIAMAEMLIGQLEGHFDPTSYTDAYREALEEVVEAKLSGAEIAKAPAAAPTADVVDLVAALRASVEAAKARRAEATESQAS